MRVLIGIALAACCCSIGTTVLALDPSLRISQHAHTAWTVRDGDFKDPISSIAQTPDGYLWLGTQFGLLRFDGVRHVLWAAGRPAPPQHQYPQRVCRQRRPSVDRHTARAGKLEGRDADPSPGGDGTGRFDARGSRRHGLGWHAIPSAGKLCAFRRDGVQCYGDKGEFGVRASSVYEDRAGNLWVGSETALWRWKPGPVQGIPWSISRARTALSRRTRVRS